MRGRVVEIEVVFLHVLAMVAFIAREAEEPFFQNRVVLVPGMAHITPLFRVPNYYRVTGETCRV